MSQRDVDPFDLAGQQAAESKLDAAAKLRRQIEKDDIAWLMSDKRGRRIVWRLLGWTGVFRNPFTGNAETYFRCGEQNIGQRLLAELHMLCPDRYHEMVKEQQTDAKR